MLHTNLLLQKFGKGNNSVITGEWVMVLKLCISSHCPLSMCQVSFKSPQYFQRYALDKPIIKKVRKGNKYSYVSFIHIFYLIALYQVSFDSHLYFKR